MIEQDGGKCEPQDQERNIQIEREIAAHGTSSLRDTLAWPANADRLCCSFAGIRASREPELKLGGGDARLGQSTRGHGPAPYSHRRRPVARRWTPPRFRGPPLAHRG